MRKINLTTEPKQKFDIVFEDTVIIVEFRFSPTVQSWFMNIIYKDEVLINGKRVNIGLGLLKQLNVPFDFVALDNQNTGIDPFKQDDFQSRVSLYLLEREEVKEIKGYDVP